MPSPLPPLETRIAVQHLSVDYHGVVALYDASLQVKAASICGA